MPTDLEGPELIAEKADRREFIDLLKRMLTLDQERRITPGEALNHPFVTLNHLMEYGHCPNVSSSVQMMDVCRRGRFGSRSSLSPPNNNNETQSYANLGGQGCRRGTNRYASRASLGVSNNNNNNNSNSNESQAYSNHEVAAAALVNNIVNNANAANMTLTLNTLQNQIPAGYAHLAQPTANFYHQVAAPRVSQDASRQFVMPPFALPPGLGGPGGNAPGGPPGPYQSLNSPAKHMVNMVSGQRGPAVHLQPNLLAPPQYVPVAVQWPTTAQAAQGSNRQIFVPPGHWTQQLTANAAQRAAYAAIQQSQQQSLGLNDDWSRSVVLERTAAAMLQAAAPDQPTIIPVADLGQGAGDSIYDQLARVTDRNNLLAAAQQQVGSWMVPVTQPSAAHQQNAHHHGYISSQPLPAHGAAILAQQPVASWSMVPVTQPSAAHQQNHHGGYISGQQLAHGATLIAAAQAQQVGSWSMVPVAAQPNPAHQQTSNQASYLSRQPLPAHGATLLAAIPSSKRRQTIATNAAAAAMAAVTLGVNGVPIPNGARMSGRAKENNSQLSPVKKRVKESSPPKYPAEMMLRPLGRHNQYLDVNYAATAGYSPLMDMNQADLFKPGTSGNNRVVVKESPPLSWAPDNLQARNSGQGGRSYLSSAAAPFSPMFDQTNTTGQVFGGNSSSSNSNSGRGRPVAKDTSPTTKYPQELFMLRPPARPYLDSSAAVYSPFFDGNQATNQLLSAAIGNASAASGSQDHRNGGRSVVVMRGKTEGNGTKKSSSKHQTITLDDTPSPAVSVITISDSSDDEEQSQSSAAANSSAPAIVNHLHGSASMLDFGPVSGLMYKAAMK